ncbi:hypothetical protein [Brevibacterium renqingii]|uniref:hypothetical protein n=1 Tax=Brevibacterium renqingii TaxID=2776916 RepID=UPI001FE2F2D5|nr:hypothetical protein [Brevibacterium renqingii]
MRGVDAIDDVDADSEADAASGTLSTACESETVESFAEAGEDAAPDEAVSAGVFSTGFEAAAFVPAFLVTGAFAFAGLLTAVDSALDVFFDAADALDFLFAGVGAPFVLLELVFADEEPGPAVFEGVAFDAGVFEGAVLEPDAEGTFVLSAVDSGDLADPPAFVLRRREDCMDAAGSLRAVREVFCSFSVSSPLPPEKNTSTGRSLEFASGINAPSPRPRPRFLRSATTYSSIRDFFSGFSIREGAAGIGVI